MAFVSRDNPLIAAFISSSKAVDVIGGVPGGINEGVTLGEQQTGSGNLTTLVDVFLERSGNTENRDGVRIY